MNSIEVHVQRDLYHFEFQQIEAQWMNKVSTGISEDICDQFRTFLLRTLLRMVFLMHFGFSLQGSKKIK